jgi:1,4-alpha-glucan branching enzyme
MIPETQGSRVRPASHLPSAGAIHAIVDGRHGDPFAVLGPHSAREERWSVRAFIPDADAVDVELADGELVPMECVHEAGFFVALIDSQSRPDYRLRIVSRDEARFQDDPYRFDAVLDAEAMRAVRGIGPREVEDVLGARLVTHEGVEGALFAVWAANARRVSVVGDFNAWDGRRHPMRLRHDAGVWELFVPGVGAKVHYKFEILDRHGHLMPLKADPLAFAAEQPPATASILVGPPQPHWSDAEWLARAASVEPRKAPMSIYECHLGSWARVVEEGNRFLTYRELAERLVPYVVELGFTHIEMLPITEFPFDGSWGYQPVSLFAPTSRFGSPDDFAFFVDAAHRAGLGVILDWVPAHFPNDPHGLGNFDGTHLYEHADPRQGFHQDWGTYIYNFGREEVTSFLVANARYWLERFHLDGIRVDAVASMLYLDYSRNAGEWVPNQFGGNQNLEAIAFLRRMNEAAYATRAGVVTIAEESTAWPGVSQPTYAGGLGFGFKWNMGWMHDTLTYMSKDPLYRAFHHHNLTFGLLYAFSENFVLPLSHDEVVHGKGSLLNKMPGDRWQRFANLRAYFGFMWAHPGKKLLFMGGEFAQEREWNHDVSLDWHLLEQPEHEGMHRLITDLNGAYRRIPALHQRDCEASGFRWLVADDSQNSVLAFARFGEDGTAPVVVVCNFTPMPRENYRVGVPSGGFWNEVLNTDAEIYAGSNMGNLGGVSASDVPSHGLPHSVSLILPPLATIILECAGAGKGGLPRS